MPTIYCAFGSAAVALIAATSAIMLLPLLVAGSWLARWILEHRTHA